MKVIELQTLFDGDQRVAIEKHDGYCLSVMENTYIKDLDKSEYKEYDIDLLSCGNYELWIRL